MIRKETIVGPCRLLLGDCMEILPTLPKVDAVVTDPPYGLGEKWNGGGGSAKSTWKFNPNEAKSWDGAPHPAVPSLASFRQCIIWGGNYYPMPPSRCWLVWDKKQNDDWTTGQCELAWTNLNRTVRAFRYAQCELANEGPKYHPTQKPLALMKWCMKWVEGDTILDPFMGSGTTGVACIKTGRQFTGIEIDETYYDIAVRRCREAWGDGSLFDERTLKASTPELFAESA